MKRYYRDFYGSTASIEETPRGKWRLRVYAGTWHVSTYETFRGARAAMARMSDGWREVDA